MLCCTQESTVSGMARCFIIILLFTIISLLLARSILKCLRRHLHSQEYAFHCWPGPCTLLTSLNNFGQHCTQPTSVTNRYWLMTSASRACSWLATAKYTMDKVLNMNALPLPYPAFHPSNPLLMPMNFLSSHLLLPLSNNNPPF